MKFTVKKLTTAMTMTMTMTMIRVRNGWRLVLWASAALYLFIRPNGAFVIHSSPSPEKTSTTECELKAENVDIPKGTTRTRTRTIRGSNYGDVNNSSIPTAQECAAAVGVRPPLEASSKTWKRAWKIGHAAIPMLHLFDKLGPPDSKLSLTCLWWKALSANDRKSPVYDDSLAYDLLPRGSRLLVGKQLRRFYPRLHHANVEIRTAYLDQTVTRIINEIHAREGPWTKIRLISLGAGYDVRSIKFRERGLVDHAVELDLPQVIQAKRLNLESRRFQKRRPNFKKENLPQFHGVNLTHVDAVENLVTLILQSSPQTTWHTIFLFEGVMIYLNEGVPEALLNMLSRVLEKTGKRGSLVFADRLENIPVDCGDLTIARRELAKNGWNITHWLPKPGLARHMGCAEPLQIS
jgi:O-methyltransferase involved in polyketide biosynthesis